MSASAPGPGRGRREAGFVLLPLVLLLSLALTAAFLLRPSFDREELLEAGRLRGDQARAAAEGAAALALHRQADVAETEIGRATATATYRREGEAVVVAGEARVPSLRGAWVRARVEIRYAVREDGGLELLAWR